MHNTLPPFDPKDALDGVLVPARVLSERKKSQSLLEQAQGYAKKIVKHAELDACDIRNTAFSAGYQAGIMLSVTTVADYLQNSDEIYRQFHAQVNRSMQHNLRHVLDGEKIFGLLIEGWLGEIIQKEERQKPLVLLIPALSPNTQSDLVAFIKTIWKGEVQVKHHAENRYVIKHDDMIAEFAPETWISQQKVATEYSQQLTKELSLLSREAVEHLLGELAKRLIN